MAILVMFGAWSPARVLEGLGARGGGGAASSRRHVFDMTRNQDGARPLGHEVRVWPEVGNPDDIKYAIVWKPPAGELAKLKNLAAIFSYGAGVDALMEDATLPAHVPVVRFVDPDLTQRMTEYVALHTLFHHRRMGEYLGKQTRREWGNFGEPLAGDVGVGLMGIGVLGSACAARLKALGYDVAGWSRTRKTDAGFPCFSGTGQLDAFLARTDILVTLLPLTPATRGILNRKLFANLRRGGALPGPVLINPGRGGLQVEVDILAALETGTLYSATLDVFETEPLPAGSPLWQHPRIVVTPHNASDSDGRNVARYALQQIAAFEAGRPLENVVDGRQGY